MPRMKALILNCTLKKAPEESNTRMLAGEVIPNLDERGVECETVRLVDLNIAPGVSSDEGDGDEWPGVRQKILDSDIRVFATPTWLGQSSSFAQRALERMDAMLSEQNEAGQLIAYGRVAGFVVTGNEDGAHIISQLAQGVIDIGFCVPHAAWTYWKMGPGPGPTYPETDHGKEWTKAMARTYAQYLFHVARALQETPIPTEE